ncbi:MAG: hypothetical protein IKN43_04245 [Selenomonadaceae bacterium]|nr:hypothetical protein [Selenomonadaceae bacterium]
MESKIAKYLHLKNHPVAILWAEEMTKGVFFLVNADQLFGLITLSNWCSKKKGVGTNRLQNI